MLKRLTLTPATAAEVAGAGREGYPYEICGALIGSYDGDAALVNRLASLPNSAEEAERRRRFAIDPLLIVRLDRELRATGQILIGFYHSHPDHPAQWSKTDHEEAHWTGCSYVITSVEKGKAAITNSFELTGSDETDKQLRNETVEIA